MTNAITWPTAFIPAMRAIWLRTLFPGKSPTAEKPRAGVLLLLIEGFLFAPKPRTEASR